MNEFYLYAYLDPRKPGNYTYNGVVFTHEPFYIGKGHGDRCYTHLKGPSGRDRNFHKHNKIKKILKECDREPIIEKFIVNLTEQQAFNLEKTFIKLIGRNDISCGPLTNMTDGGEGPSGKVLTEETKQKLRELALEQNLSGENNPFYGKTHTVETKQKISDHFKNYKWSDETIEKRSKSLKGRKHSKETIKRIVSKRQKEYIIIDPEGNEFHIKGLNEFCRNNNLNPSSLSAVAQGRRKHHKGWKCFYDI
jgi:hypothetical protein